MDPEMMLLIKSQTLWGIVFHIRNIILLCLTTKKRAAQMVQGLGKMTALPQTEEILHRHEHSVFFGGFRAYSMVQDFLHPQY